MNRLLKDQWVDALISGQYTQGQNKAYDPNTRAFCVSGVLLDILAHTHPDLVVWYPEMNNWITFAMPPKNKHMISDCLVRILFSENLIAGKRNVWVQFIDNMIIQNDAGVPFESLAMQIDWWIFSMETV